MHISPAQLPPFRQATRPRCVGNAAKHSACSANKAAAGATRRVQWRGIAVGLRMGDGVHLRFSDDFQMVVIKNVNI